MDFEEYRKHGKYYSRIKDMHLTIRPRCILKLDKDILKHNG